MGIVGRSKLDHPALGTSGGSILHGQIETIYQTISDHLGARFKSYASQANSTTVTYEHGFGVAFSELTVLLYTGTHPNLTRVSDPAASGWTIVATPASLTTSINITAPATGGPHTFAVFVVQGRTITPLSITNADIAASAAIADSKLSISASTVTGKALTGYTIAGSASALATTDTVLGALGKLEASVNAKEPAIGTLSIAKGGTNSGTALNNNRIMVSSSGAIKEATAITADSALISDANGIPVASSVSATSLATSVSDTTNATSLATGVSKIVKRDANGDAGFRRITVTDQPNTLNGLLPSQTSNAGKVLGTDGTNASWQSALTNPMTTAADMIVGGASGAPSRLAKGTANQVLGMNSGATAQEYKTFATATDGSDFAITHTANTVTFKLPSASATARGVVTSAGQTFGGKKTFNDGASIKGDSTGTAISAGFIGETLTATPTSVTASGYNSATSCASLNLTAGVWLVKATASGSNGTRPGGAGISALGWDIYDSTNATVLVSQKFVAFWANTATSSDAAYGVGSLSCVVNTAGSPTIQLRVRCDEAAAGTGTPTASSFAGGLLVAVRIA